MKCPIYEFLFLWNVLFIKFPIYDFVIYKMSFYEMPQYHIILFMLCLKVVLLETQTKNLIEMEFQRKLNLLIIE